MTSLTATYSKGGEQHEDWMNMRVIMYESDCKFNEHYNIECKDIGYCKLFVIRTDERVVQVKRLNDNA